MHNGYLPEHTVQAGIGDVTVKVPKVRIGVATRPATALCCRPI
jgi:hypothetical protein